MAKTPTEPTNLVLEQLRLIRAGMDALNEKMDAEFKAVRHEISVIRRQTIGEVYKANKTFASFADLEARIEALEHKVYTD